MSEKKDYFDYVANVLGVKSVLLSQDAESIRQVVPLLIAVENLASYADSEYELLSKMIAALKIDMQLIKVVDLNQSQLFQPQFAILFMDELVLDKSPQDNSTENSTAQQVKTYSPRTLIKKPELKKQAWDDMQRAIIFFEQKSI